MTISSSVGRADDGGGAEEGGPGGGGETVVGAAGEALGEGAEDDAALEWARGTNLASGVHSTPEGSCFGFAQY